MYYILNPSIALRGWEGMPYAIIRKDAVKAMPVSEALFHILERCDGNTEIPDSRSVWGLLRAGLISRCGRGKAHMHLWQTYRRYANRYFPAVSWSITEQCNCNCRHCFVGVESNSDAPYFGCSDAAAFLEEAQTCGVRGIALTGGEPLMHPAFFEILEEIYKREMHVFMINTNGLLIVPELLERMKRMGCVPRMKISFDGIGRHDWLRRHPGAEEKVKQAIMLCVSEGFPVTVQMNVYPENVACLKETVSWLQEAGVQEVRLIRTADTPKWNSGENGCVMSFSEYFDSMLQFAAWFARREYSVRLDIWRMLRMDPVEKAYRICAIRHGYSDFSDQIPVCEGNRNMISVAADGELYPCHSFSGFNRIHAVSLGNVKKQKLSQMLSHGDYLDAVCETVEELTQNNPHCARCRFLRYCCGGCRAMGMLYGGSYDGVDPMMCTFFQNGYDQRIRMLLSDWNDVTPGMIRGRVHEGNDKDGRRYDGRFAYSENPVDLW